MRFDQKTVVVTGAGGGFGEGIAKRFAALGGRVVIVDLRAEHAVWPRRSINPVPRPSP